MSRKDAREKAMQILYQLESHDIDVPAQIDRFIEDRTYQDKNLPKDLLTNAPAYIDLDETDEVQLNLMKRREQFADDLESGLLVERNENDREYFNNLVAQVWIKRESLDEAYGKFLRSKWSVDRLPQLERVLLRIATYEIVEDEEIPDSVAINEAIELCHKYVDEDSYSYINAVLGQVSKNKG